MDQLSNSRPTKESNLLGGDFFLTSIIENIPDMIFVKDAKELRFVRFNKAGEDLLGYKREELIGKNDYDFFPKAEADKFIQKDREVLNGTSVVEILEETIHTRYKGQRILHTKKIPIFDDHGNAVYLLGISEDITEKKRSEREERRNMELERSNMELEQFASIVSHDLKEPLRMVSIYLGLLQQEYEDKLGEEAKEYISFAIGGANRMGALLKDLLDYSRAGASTEELSLIDANNALKAALEHLKAQIDLVKPNIEMQALPKIFANINQLTRLFQNLIGNAIKYRGPSHPTIQVSVESLKDEWCFCVKDNGIGIAPEFHDKVFQIFQRLPEARNLDGTGVGLSICRRIVERHGGQIWVESRVKEGATFYFTIPKDPKENL